MWVWPCTVLQNLPSQWAWAQPSSFPLLRTILKGTLRTDAWGAQRRLAELGTQGIVADSHSPGQPAADAQAPGAGHHLRVGTRTALGAHREWLGPRKFGLGCGLGLLLCWLLCGCFSWSTFQGIPQPQACAHPSLRGFLWVFVGEGPGFVFPTSNTEFLRKFVFSIRSPTLVKSLYVG